MTVKLVLANAKSEFSSCGSYHDNEVSMSEKFNMLLTARSGSLQAINPF